MKMDIVYLDEMRGIATRRPKNKRLQQLLTKPDEELSLDEIGELLNITLPIKTCEAGARFYNQNKRKRFFETLGGLALVLLGLLVLLSLIV
jgi:hypothetical protein